MAFWKTGISAFQALKQDLSCARTLTSVSISLLIRKVGVLAVSKAKSQKIMYKCWKGIIDSVIP